jgi:arsenite methyltransferase
MLTLQFNEHAALKLQAAYATEDVIAQRRASLEKLALRAGETVLDAGCGPGFLCEDLADAVGQTGRVLGIDISDDLLAFARRRKGRDWLRFEKGDITAIDAPNASFDVAAVTQVLEYVQDTDRALAELYRVLRPGGRVLVVDTDWDGVVWHSTDLRRIDRIWRAWEFHCADPRLPRTLAPRLRAAGFDVVSISGFAIVNTMFDPSTYSHALAQLIVDFIERQDVLARSELDAWLADLRELNSAGRYFFSTLRCFFLAVKPGAG